jgi:hypothetical protein
MGAIAASRDVGHQRRPGRPGGLAGTTCSLRTGLLGALTACWVGAELDDRMRLNNWSIAASYDTARIFAGFGSSTAQVDHLAPAPHRLVLRQHAGVGLCSGSIRHFKRRVMGGM